MAAILDLVFERFLKDCKALKGEQYLVTLVFSPQLRCTLKSMLNGIAEINI